MLIIDGRKFLSRTPKCYLQRSWAHDPVNSKIDPQVRMPKRRANREPNLIVVRGHVSWLMLSLLALSRQKQLVKSSQVKSPNEACLLQDCLSWRNVHYICPPRLSQKVWFRARNGTAENNLQNKILFYQVSTYAFGSMSSTDALRNKSKGMVLWIAWNAIWQEILANSVVK